MYTKFKLYFLCLRFYLSWTFKFRLLYINEWINTWSRKGIKCKCIQEFSNFLWLHRKKLSKWQFAYSIIKINILTYFIYCMPVFLLIWINYSLNDALSTVHKAGREELESVLSLLDKILSLLPELIGKRWQLHSLTRIFSKLLHKGNSQRLRAEAIRYQTLHLCLLLLFCIVFDYYHTHFRYFLLWYQALGENATKEVHHMFATLVPGFPDPPPSNLESPSSQLHIPLKDIPQETAEYTISNILQHPNFTDSGSSKKISVSPEQHSTGFMSKLVNASSAIFHDTNIVNPVQPAEILPLLPASGHEKNFDNESKYFLETLLEAMASNVTKIYWKDRTHCKAMKTFSFLLEKFKLYYLPHICPQYDYNSSLYNPNLGEWTAHLFTKGSSPFLKVF